MSKNKLKKFSELESFEHVIQPSFDEIFEKDFRLKGKWKEELFGNQHPLVLELGCGKGEYTVGQARANPGKNFMGVDIKGARIWMGAATARQEEMKNVAFLRTRIEFITSFFEEGEVDEIWITFPDPQLKKRRNKKRLTGALFLNRYRNFLVDKGVVHLKTDNDVLYRYTEDLVTFNHLEIIASTPDLYHSSFLNETLSIRTYYENKFLAEGMNINYIAFRLPSGQEIMELPADE